MVTKLLAFGSLVLASLPSLTAAQARETFGASPKNPAALGAAPNFSLPSLRDLRLITKNDYAGKVLYVEIWRTDCPQCQREADYIVSLRRKYSERGFEVLGVADENYDPKSEPAQRVLDYAKEKKFEHPLVLNDGGEFHSAYYTKIKSTPSAFIIKRDGSIEFVGQDAARPEWRADLEKEIEKCLDAPAPAAAAPVLEVKPLPDFTLMSMRGGVIRPSDLRGKPTLLAMLSPSLMARHAPTLAVLDAKYAPMGLRVLGVSFGPFKEVAADAEARKYTFEIAVPDPDAQDALVGNDYIPKFIFVTPDGKMLKIINTVYGRERGIELSVFERYASLLVGKDGLLPKMIEAGGDRAFRHPELGFTIDAGAMRAADAMDGKARFVGAGSQELKVSLEAVAGTNESAERVAANMNNSVQGRVVESQAWQTVQGASCLVVRDQWRSPIGAMKSVRLFVPTKLGVYVVSGSASETEFASEGAALEHAVLSFQSGIAAGN